MESVNKKWDEAHSLAQLEFEHRTVQNRCGYIACNETSGLQQCNVCKIRQYCCKEHKSADEATHKRFCRPPIKDVVEPDIVRPADYVSMPSEQRTSTASTIVKLLLDALGSSVYPPENLESIFGIQLIDDTSDEQEGEEVHYIGIDTPIGTVMYGCWNFLAKCNNKAYALDIAVESGAEKMAVDGEFDLGIPAEESDYQFDVSGVNVINKQLAAEAKATFALEVVQAIVDGRLPAFFKYKILQYDKLWCELGNTQDAYVAEVKRRDFKGIKWNRVALANLAGK